MKTCAKLVGFGVCMALAVPWLRADEVSDLRAQLQALQQQMNVLQQRLESIANQQQSLPRAGSVDPEADRAAGDTAVPARSEPSPAAGQADRASEAKAIRAAQPKHGFLERKPGSDLTFYTPGGEMTLYGKLDLSLDATTKGLGGMNGPDGNPPAGRVGWMPAVSTNLSYIGIRGFQRVDSLPFNFVYQLETQLDITATAGTTESNSNESNLVKGALTSRNSFVGLASEHWGALKIGKTWAPYRISTDRLNPFSGMIGDYQVVMGNTGGDNRVEFGTRLDHAFWYESPNWRGVTFAALFSPGQNRAMNSDNIAAGESDCTGGNIPGSGGILPMSCSDGSFGDAVSGSVAYAKGPLYVTAAYERHMKVNRSSDITGIYASANDTSVQLAAQDVADEDAAKVGVQYAFPAGTTVSGIVETMHRYVPTDLQFQNERQRLGTWLALSQQLSKPASVHFGWAHAFRAPGDPGQHADSPNTPPGGVDGTDGTAGAHANNQANMFTAALKYQFSRNIGAYADWALTANGPAAHYDLGAGGRGVTTDCHDAVASAGGMMGSNPHCWTGSNLMGVSVGMVWRY
jgi:predicted porin